MSPVPDDETLRIGIILPADLLEEFTRILQHRHYISRSKGIRDAIMGFTLNNQSLPEDTRELHGIIILTRDRRKVALMLPDIIDEHQEIIRAMLHKPISPNWRLEIFLVYGMGRQIKKLVDQFESAKDAIEIIQVNYFR